MKDITTRMNRLAARLVLAGALLLPWSTPPAPLLAAAWPEYPYDDGYVATAFGAPREMAFPTFRTAAPEPISLQVAGRPVPGVFDQWRALNCSAALQSGPAPLAFVISGTGGAHDSMKMRFLQNVLYDNGYHVVNLPSSTHPDFIVSVSSSRVPGYLPDDAADLRRVMRWLKDDVEKRATVTDCVVLGYSLGGAQAAYVAWLDEKDPVLGIGKALMINPAVDLYDSAARLDALLEERNLGGKEPLRVVDRLLNKFSDFYLRQERLSLGEDLPSQLAGAVGVTREELLVAIGGSFRLSSMSMIFVSDACIHAGYIVPAERRVDADDDLAPYFDATMRIGFQEYFDEYLYPFLRHRDPGLTREEAKRRLSLESIADYLAASSKVEVMTNVDDFILTPDNLRFLRQTLGARASIHPRGGHCGNLTYAPFMAEILERLAARD